MTELYGNRYEAMEQVGSGGFATVYRGTDRSLGREVAIKVMHPHLADRGDARARFIREAKATAKLQHPNIVGVYDFPVESGGKAFLVTEFVHGETLTQFVRDHGPFLPQAAALIGHAVAAAVGHAHAKGVVHRDIKPDNLMISRDGQIKLMDFGIATVRDMEGMTATGAIVGSPAHMSPEQVDGQQATSACDIWAFGTVLYHLVTKRLPFTGSNPHALFRRILDGLYEPASRLNPQVDREFDRIIGNCLQVQPADRYPDMAALQVALGQYLKQYRLSDAATHLSRFLQGPEQFQWDLRPELVALLTGEGRRHVRAGHLALAIDAYNRALMLDGEASEPRQALDELTTRARRRKAWTRIGLATATGLGLMGGLWLALAPSSQPAARHSVRPPVHWAALPSPRATQFAALPASPSPSDAPALQPAPMPVVPTTTEVSLAEAMATRRPGRGGARRPSAQRELVVAPPVVVEPVATPPPLPPERYRVHLGAEPTSASLWLRDAKLGRGRGRALHAGVAQEMLEAGSYVLTCEWPQEACAQLHRRCEPQEFPFEVPTLRRVVCDLHGRPSLP